MKRNRSIHFALSISLLAIGLNLFAQENKETREVKDIEKVSFSISAKLEIQQGDTESLVLIGEKEDLEKIITRMDNGRLIIRKERGSVRRISDVKVLLTIKNLKKLGVAGSGNVKFTSDFTTADFVMDLAGSGNIECKKLEAEMLMINIAGSGDVQAGGKVESYLEINISGSGDVDAVELKTKEVVVNISGSGDSEVWASDMLECNISGSGDVRYKGTPKVKARINGSGSTRAL